VLFEGDFGFYKSQGDLDTAWSWANQAGLYQTYIFGSGRRLSEYVEVGPQFCNRGLNAGCVKGAAFSIDGTSRWNGQTMLRTEVIPAKQPSAQGLRIYRFSMSVRNLSPSYEHQLVFFESHFCDIKFGNPGADLQFWVSGNKHWSTGPAGQDWHNFAFEVDYGSGGVSLWYSKGGDPMNKVVERKSAPVSQSDFHVGILRLPQGNNQDPVKTSVWYSNVAIFDSTADLISGVSPSPSPTPNIVNDPTPSTPSSAPSSSSSLSDAVSIDSFPNEILTVNQRYNLRVSYSSSSLDNKIIVCNLLAVSLDGQVLSVLAQGVRRVSSAGVSNVSVRPRQLAPESQFHCWILTVTDYLKNPTQSASYATGLGKSPMILVNS